MKTVRFTVIALFMMIACAATAFAQAAAQPPAKVALVNTLAFYAEKSEANPTGGITKILKAYEVLDTEFDKDFKDLEAKGKRLETLQTEVENLRKAATPNQQAIQTKMEEGERLQREFNFKQEDVKARFASREAVLVGPIIEDVGKAIAAFAKQKGYTLVLDSGKLFQAQVLIYLEKTTDVTTEFIQYYNTRPAGTASTSQ